MKKFLSKSEQGFTLVELMVVVAIIGILSAIAVPNFKKYQAKAKQSEAKITLAAIYAAEVGAQADYNTYSTCLLQIGFEQSPRGYYLVGFNAGVAQSLVNTVPVCLAGIAVDSAQGAGNLFVADQPSVSPADTLRGGIFSPTAVALVSIGQGGVVAADGTPQTTFTAGAAGCISAACLSEATLDRWTISETKAMFNTFQGF